MSIIWPKDCPSHIKKLGEGNERIIGVEFRQETNSTFIINVYLPTYENGSLSEYERRLDIQYSILCKYRDFERLLSVAT